MQEYLQLYRKLQNVTGLKRPYTKPPGTHSAAAPTPSPASSSSPPASSDVLSAADLHFASARTHAAHSETPAEASQTTTDTAGDHVHLQADLALQDHELSDSVDTGSLDDVDELSTALALSRQQPANDTTSSSGEQQGLRSYGNSLLPISHAEIDNSSSNQDIPDGDAAVSDSSDESAGTSDTPDVAESSEAESLSDDESEAAALGGPGALDVDAMQRRAAQLRAQMG